MSSQPTGDPPVTVPPADDYPQRPDGHEGQNGPDPQDAGEVTS